MLFEVIVGNIGTVHTEKNRVLEALEAYSAYVELSKRPWGRCSGESVILMRDGEIIREYEGTLNATPEE